jgi:hypothetical protein
VPFRVDARDVEFLASAVLKDQQQKIKESMKKLGAIIAIVIFSSVAAFAQSKTTEALQKDFDTSLALYFYKNTLRMLNQTENKEFDEMVKDIEKMKFLMVDKSSRGFGKQEYEKLLNDYQAEDYEAIMTSRYQGKNFDIYLRDKKGSKLGTVVLVNDSTNLFVLDIVGKIDVSKAGALFSTLDSNTDIGKQIRGFVDTKSRAKNTNRD